MTWKLGQKYKSFIPATSVNNCLQLSIYTKAVGTWVHLFKLPSLYKTCSPRPSPPANLVKMPIQVVVLAFDLSVLFLRTGGGGGDQTEERGRVYYKRRGLS